MTALADGEQGGWGGPDTGSLPPQRQRQGEVTPRTLGAATRLGEIDGGLDRIGGMTPLVVPAPVAQWIEQLPSKQLVGGSSPSRGASLRLAPVAQQEEQARPKG